MAIRAASICRASSQTGSSACKANSPKAMVLPRWAVPRMRPRCCLRCFDLDGDSNMHLLQVIVAAARPQETLNQLIHLPDLEVQLARSESSPAESLAGSLAGFRLL